MTIRMLVVDDHEVVRRGLVSLLKGFQIEVIGEAEGGGQAVDLARELHPDVVLMDVRMEPSGGLEALDTIHRELPDTRVVMHSTYDNPTYIARSLTYGAADYVLKGTNRRGLIDAIEHAAQGKGPPTASLVHKVVATMKTRARPTAQEMPLTSREAQVLRHLALGLSNKEIGRSLEISVETVKEHVQNVIRKLDVKDRTQAAVWAWKNNVV